MNRKSISVLCLVLFMGLLGLCGCGSPASDMQTETEADMERMELQYAENFTVDYYGDGYTCLSIVDGTRLLVVL